MRHERAKRASASETYRPLFSHMVWRYKRQYRTKHWHWENLWINYASERGASELGNFSHFHILKLLFPSIFCWYFWYFISETHKTQKHFQVSNWAGPPCFLFIWSVWDTFCDNTKLTTTYMRTISNYIFLLNLTRPMPYLLWVTLKMQWTMFIRGWTHILWNWTRPNLSFYYLVRRLN